MKGFLRYGVPNLVPPLEERSLYSFPKLDKVKDELQELYDMRTCSKIAQGPAGLDVQGFTWLKHESSPSHEELLQGQNLEDFYVKECEDLICKITGASRARVDGLAVRQKVGNEVEKQDVVDKAGNETDQALMKTPRDQIRVGGRDKSASIGPARIAHVDYSLKGFQEMVRWGRHDIRKVAAHVLEAQDAVARGEGQQPVPRHAAYSIWRPLSKIQRDPLALLDWRSTDPKDLSPWRSRVLSGVTESGESTREAYNVLPPKDPASHRWYILPDQSPDEVLVIKFADSGADGLGVAPMCCHGSPNIPGTESLPARESVECRVFAFWD